MTYGWGGSYSYTIIKVRKKSLIEKIFGLSIEDYVATVEHQGKTIEVAIDPTDKGTYGYDHTICFAIYWNFYRNKEKEWAGKALEGKTVTVKQSNTDGAKDEPTINDLIKKKAYKKDKEEKQP